MRRRLWHWKEVFKSAVAAAGLVAGIVTVVVGGSVLAAGGFLLHERHRTFAVVVFASGVLAALLEGSYRVWDATNKDLETTRARLRELDSEEAKRSYLDEQIGEAERLQRAIESLRDSGRWDFRTRRTIRNDIVHWEDGVRADMREWFANGVDLLFDSDEGLIPVVPLSLSLTPTLNTSVGGLPVSGRLRKAYEGSGRDLHSPRPAERLRESREHREVGVKRHAVRTPDTVRTRGHARP